MKLHDSFKCRSSASGKVLPANVTIDIALRRLRSCRPPVLHSYRRFSNRSGIPHYQVHGSPAFRSVTGAAGANGKGVTWEYALASGLMELIERYSCYAYLYERGSAVPPPLLCRRGVFKAFLGNFPHPDCLGPSADVCSRLAAYSCRWYCANDIAGKAYRLPLGLFSFLLEGCNGMASGNTLEEALLQGMCEVIERHCLSRILEGSATVADVPLDGVPAATKRLISRFHRCGQRVAIKDLSLGLGIPVLGVVRLVSRGYCHLTAGVASSPQEALSRALTESAQTDAVQLFRPVNKLRHVLGCRNTRQFSSIADISSENIKDEVRACDAILSKAGMKTFFSDATHPRLNIPSVIVYVAGAQFSSRVIDPVSSGQARSIAAGIMHEAYAARRRSWMDASASCVQTRADNAVQDFYRGLFCHERADYLQASRRFIAVLRNAYAPVEARHGAWELLRRPPEHH